MSLLHIYWWSVLAVFLVESFAVSTWAFGGGWQRHMRRCADWADCWKGEAKFFGGTAIILGVVAISFASFWAIPLYIVVGLGYLASKNARQRCAVRENITGKR